jgi:hypothetical protein
VGQADGCERARETETVQELKAKRDQPRIALRDVASMVCVSKQFACEEYDAKCDRRLNRRSRHIDEAERRRRESDGMGDSERHHCEQKLANVANKEH